MSMEVIQREFMLKIDLDNSIREEEPPDAKVYDSEARCQPPEGFDDWC